HLFASSLSQLAPLPTFLLPSLLLHLNIFVSTQVPASYLLTALQRIHVLTRSPSPLTCAFTNSPLLATSPSPALLLPLTPAPSLTYQDHRLRTAYRSLWRLHIYKLITLHVFRTHMSIT